MEHSTGRGLTQASLRSANLGVVLRELLASPEPLSRAEIAASAQMTRGTVSRLVDELVGAGIIAELEPVAQGRGRPRVPLVPGTAWVALGLEVNVTHVAARVVDLSGRVVAELLRPGSFAGSDPGQVLGRLAREAIALLPEGAGLVGVQLALPGLVDRSRLRLLRAPNLGWEEVDLAALLPTWPDQAPLRVGNEADCAALCTAWQAPGRPGAWSSFLYVSGEVGIGSAIVQDGSVVSGNHGWAGELGHVPVEPEGRPCGCGSRGCLEQYVGQAALVRDSGLADVDQIAQAWAAGDPNLIELVSQAGHRLGRALAAALNLIDVQRIVLGGHLASLFVPLRPVLDAELSTRVMWASQVPPELVTASSDPAAASRGAGLSAWSDLIANPERWIAREVTTR